MSQISSYFLLYHGAKKLHVRWNTVSEDAVIFFWDRYQKNIKNLSEGRLVGLKNSARRLSMDIYKSMLVRVLDWLNEDQELEDFVTGISGLCESQAFVTHDSGDAQPTIRNVLASLPGPTSFHPSLTWSIIQLAQRASTNKLPKSVQERRTQACLRALYYIPGAIRDILAPYALGKHYCLEILPLLNSSDSLTIINELWGTPDYDVALSVRCLAAVMSAFMITPPHKVLDNFVAPDLGFIGDDNSGKQFLAKRLRVDADEDGGVVPEYDLRSDSARLRNIVRFLADIKDTLQYMNTSWWTFNDADSIRQERQTLYDARRTEEYRIGRGTFDQQGDRASRAFVPAAQQDLIAVTLEILARDPVKNAATSERDAFRNAWMKLTQVASAQVRTQTSVLPEFRS